MSETIDDKLIEEIVRRVVKAMGGDEGGAIPQAEAKAPRRVRPDVLTRTLGLVVDRPDAKVEAALAAVVRSGVPLAGFGEDECPIVNTRAMCEALAAGKIAGGVIIDRYAAGGMILSAKCCGARPVQGVNVQAVQAGLRQFDANVLVIGHAGLSLYEIKSMIDRFHAGRRMGRDRTPLLDALDELEAS